MQYRPDGSQIRIPFTVPDLTGANTPGLTWTVDLFVKSGTKVTSGTEFNSISVDRTNDTDFYELLFTPTAGSEAVYLVKVLSDASIPDVNEETLEPDYTWLFLYATMVRNTGVSPETLEFLKPDGVRLVKFNVYRSGNQEFREEV